MSSYNPLLATPYAEASQLTAIKRPRCKLLTNYTYIKRKLLQLCVFARYDIFLLNS